VPTSAPDKAVGISKKCQGMVFKVQDQLFQGIQYVIYGVVDGVIYMNVDDGINIGYISNEWCGYVLTILYLTI
jgi:hypothetical protein